MFHREDEKLYARGSAPTSGYSRRGTRTVLVFIRWKERPSEEEEEEEEEESWLDALASRGGNVGTSVLRPACSPLSSSRDRENRTVG